MKNSQAQDFQITRDKLENKSYLTNLQPSLEKLTAGLREINFNKFKEEEIENNKTQDDPNEPNEHQ